jgi:hypothetical protein
MSEFKITRVSMQEPRAWKFTDKRTGEDVHMETHKVMFGGVDEPVQINRKPGNPPRTGEVLAGSIEDSEYGKKFKADPKPRPAFAPKDTGEIKAQMAVKAAANLWSSKDWLLGDIEKTASALFAMVERVKTGTSASVPQQAQSGYEKAKATVEAIKTKQPVDEIFEVTDDPVNYDDIPF